MGDRLPEQRQASGAVSLLVGQRGVAQGPPGEQRQPLQPSRVGLLQKPRFDRDQILAGQSVLYLRHRHCSCSSLCIVIASGD